MNIKTFRIQHPEYDDMTDSELTAALHSKYYADVPKYDFDLFFIGRPDHNDLESAAVTAKDSLVLQNADPKIKPVVVGTNQEILELKKKGYVGRGKEVFMIPQGKAYVIDAKGVQSIYGASLAGSVKMAKMDILKGNDAHLLGYPDRQKGAADMIVNKQGGIVTGLPEISDEAKSGNIAYGAEGDPLDLAKKGFEVSQSIKTNKPKWKHIKRSEDDTQQRETEALNLDPAVLHQGNLLVGKDNHDDILELHGLDKSEGERGFKTPDGLFLTRAQGIDYLKQVQPETYEKVKPEGELHSQALNEAYND